MNPRRAVHYVMGTLFDCTLFDQPRVSGQRLLSQAVGEVRRLERLLSRHDPDSALSRLNRQAGRGPVQVEAELWQLLAQCAALTRQTDGAFDVSAGSRTGTHGTGSAFCLYPDCRVALAAGACLDLGAIGKGYAVDRLQALLQAGGVSSALINFGESSLYLLGEPPETQAWPIVVRGLHAEDVLGVLSVKAGALSTSHSFGRRRANGASHILHPHTGLPLARPCLSTIVAPSATLAEALSTAVLVAGAAWRDLLANFPAAAGLYVGPDRVPQCSAGLTLCFQPYAEVP